VNFAGASLRQALFTGAHLGGANFEGADLYQCHFAGARLEGARLRNADLTYADFSRSDLSAADARGASMFRTILHRARTSDAQFTDRARARETDTPLAQAEEWQRPHVQT
jgi:uncharacterized protein YjbI with pentapeptide repeats